MKSFILNALPKATLGMFAMSMALVSTAAHAEHDSVPIEPRCYLPAQPQLVKAMSLVQHAIYNPTCDQRDYACKAANQLKRAVRLVRNPRARYPLVHAIRNLNIFMFGRSYGPYLEKSVRNINAVLAAERAACGCNTCSPGACGTAGHVDGGECFGGQCRPGLNRAPAIGPGLHRAPAIGPGLNRAPAIGPGLNNPAAMGRPLGVGYSPSFNFGHPAASLASKWGQIRFGY